MAKLTFELYKFVLPYVIAKERSDCGNLNPSRDTIYELISKHNSSKNVLTMGQAPMGQADSFNSPS